MKTPFIKDLIALCKDVKKQIGNEYRAFEGDELPGIQLTIGCDTETGKWSWQTGDNSYSGGAYFYPTWAVVGVYRRSNCTKLAREIVKELEENSPITD